jgi:hypothetical protein
MIRVRRKQLFFRISPWVVLIGLSGLPILSQSSSLATAVPVPAQSLVSADSAPKAPVTVLEDTLIRVMTNESVNSKRAEQGTPVLFTVSEDVVIGDVLAIPRGSIVHGTVIRSKKAGVLTGSPELTLKLVSLNLGGRSYPLYTYQFKVTGTSKTKPTEAKALRGAYLGAAVGSISNPRMGRTGAGRAASMGTDAGIGAGVGTLVSAATPGPGIWIPSESQVDFYLAAPVTVTPVSAKEAARLAQGLHSGGPTLYVRGDTP